MGNDDNKVTILLTSDNIGPLTRTHDLHYNGVSYYENPLGLYQKMLESEKGNQHLFTRVSSDEALLNNWPTVDLSSAERPFNQSIAAKNVNVYSTISNYMDQYNLSYDLAVDLYNTEILYAKLFEKYTKNYGNGNFINPYRVWLGNNWLGLPLNSVLSALDWDSHRNSYIDELAGIWDKICRYKGDYENGIGLDKSKKHVQALFNYSVTKQNEENEALLRSRLPALLYDADKAALYRNMNNMFLSGLLVNDGYKAMMAAQDPTTPEGQSRMDQLYLDGMSNYRPISYIGHGTMLGLYPFETAATLGAGYVGGKVTDEVVRRTSDYDSWEDLALRKFGMFPADALMSNPGMWLFSIPGARFGRDIGAEVGDLYTDFMIGRTLNKYAPTVRLPNEYISTLPESFPHLIEYRPPTRTSAAGVSGQPRGNQNTSWTQNFMGTTKRVPHPGHNKLAEIPHPGLLVPFEGNRNFGVFMGNGLELTAFLAGFGNEPVLEFGLPLTRTVYKIPSGSFFNNTVDKASGVVMLGQALNFPTLEDIRVFNLKILGINNQIPRSSRLRLVGYTWSPEETINGVTHPASFHPVYELEIGVTQADIRFDSNLGPSVADNVHDVIKSGFIDKGWNFVDDHWGGIATKPTKAGDLTVTDLHHRNIGMTLSGEPVILDPGVNYNEPWPIGTKTSFPNIFNLRASDFDFDGNFPLRSIGRIDHSILGNFRSQLASSLKSNPPAATPAVSATPAAAPIVPTTPVAAPVTPGAPVFPVNPGIPVIHFASPTSITWKQPMFLVWQPPLTVSWSLPRSYSLISNPPSTTLIRAGLQKALAAGLQRLLSFLNKNKNNFIVPLSSNPTTNSVSK